MGIIRLKGKDNLYIKVQEDGHQVLISTRTNNPELAKRMWEIFLLEWTKAKFEGYTLKEFHEKFKAYGKKNVNLQRKELYKISLEWLESGKRDGLSKSALYSREIVSRLLSQLGILYVDEIDQKAVDNFISSQEEYGYAEGTIRNNINYIKALLNYCIQKKYFKRSDFDRLEFKKISKPRRHGEISEEDFAEMIKLSEDPELKLYLSLLWETGGRRTEISDIKIEDINFERNFIKIYGKKTKKWRYVPINEKRKKQLQKYVNEERRGKDKLFDKNDDVLYYLFTRLRKMNPEWKGYTLHTFRHTFITRSLRAGIQPEDLAKITGHFDTKMIYDVYDQRGIDDLVSEVEKKLH